MRILHVIPSIAPEGGGPNQIVFDMAAIAAGSGADVTVVCTCKDNCGGPAPGGLASTSLEVIRFPTSFPQRFSSSRALRQWLRQQVRTFDVVHIHSIWSVCSLDAGRLCRRWNVPYVLRPHGSLSPYDLRKKARLKRILSRWVVVPQLRGAAALHCTTSSEARMLVTYGVEVEKVIVPLPLRVTEVDDLAPGGQFRERWAIPAKAFLFLYVGRFHRTKNLEVLLRAFDQVADEYPFAFLALVGGGDRHYERRLRRLASDLAAKRRLRFCGFLADHDKILAFRDSDSFVLPSHHENFGVAVLEAMQWGCPVVVSAHVALSEAIAEAKAGLVCETSVAAVAESMNLLLADAVTGGKVRAKLAQNARALVLSRFDRSSVSIALEDLYRRAVKWTRTR